MLERVQRMLRTGEVVTYNGRKLAMRPQSILLHGDTPGAVDLGKAIRDEIEAYGGQIVCLSRLQRRRRTKT